MITAYDVSERKRREEYVSHISQHDSLTGLPTRQLLFDRLDGMLARADRYQSRCALLMIDLDHFKRVNDSLGHHTGDQLLIQVAERFRSTLRAVDTVARMGGDEFVILLSDLNGPADATLVAEKLRAAVVRPFTLPEQTTVAIDASMGICMYPDYAQDAQSMLKNADLAMYYAKSNGGSKIALFSENIAQLAHEKEEIEYGLRESLRTGNFELHYQPEVDLQSGETVGLEALLRWRSPRLGSISPVKFIPIAEEAGLIQPIGTWVMNKACEDIRKINDHLGKSLFISVNLSPYQLEQSDLLAVVEQALKVNGLAPDRLEVEITEGVLMKDSPKANSALDALRNLGVRIAIDDFGAGFSSMSYLLRFSVDRLKIDRSFVRNCSTESNSSTVTGAIIALAHQLKLSVIAEGVETMEQVEFLKAAGCDLAQGFYYSRPVPLSALTALQHEGASPR
jgi:diguanylate cyclase (GGDEF)-like protein